MKIIVDTARFSSKPEERDQAEVVPMIRKALFDAMNGAGVVLLEPIFESTIYGAMENVGKLTSLLTINGGRIDSMDQDSVSIKIRAHFPVRVSFNLIEAARDVTSGRAVFQNVFAGFEKMQKGILTGVIKELKEKKGLV